MLIRNIIPHFRDPSLRSAAIRDDPRIMRMGVAAAKSPLLLHKPKMPVIPNETKWNEESPANYTIIN